MTVRFPTVADVGEAGLLRRISRLLPPPPEASVGIGDDAAVVAPPRGTMILTTDALVEGTHFLRSWFRPAEVGHKALAVNLSDAAAMGARPDYALVSLILPPAMSVAAVEAMYRGLARLARNAGVAVIGGNLARGERASVTVALVGSAPRGRAVTRGGSRPGDALYVSGRPGLAYLGFRLLERARPAPADGGAGGRDPWRFPAREPAWRAALVRAVPGSRPALAAFLRPVPRLALGGELHRLGATSAIDVSDGLAADLRHLAAAGARPVADAERFPVSPAFRRLAGGLELDPGAAILRGGEDYELLFTLPGASAGRLGARAVIAGTPVTRIGEIAPGPPGAFLRRKGRTSRLDAESFEHFA